MRGLWWHTSCGHEVTGAVCMGVGGVVKGKAERGGDGLGNRWCDAVG